MKFSLDHLVHAVFTPEKAAQTFEAAHQWRTVKGGEHRNWGTYNSLAYFGLSYVEWIGVRDSEVAAGSRFGSHIAQSLTRGEGVAQIALRTDNMDEVVRLWQARGIRFTGPENSSRVRPDGQTIRWRLLYPDVLENEGTRHGERTDSAQGANCAKGASYTIPFVIEWGEQDDTRSRELEKLRAAGGRCVGVHAVVQTLERINEQFQAYFGPLPSAWFQDDDYRRLEISISGTTLYFWQPLATAQSSVAKEWMVFLNQTGERTVQLDIADLDVDTAGLNTAGLNTANRASTEANELAPVRLLSPRDSLHGLIVNIKRE